METQTLNTTLHPSFMNTRELLVVFSEAHMQGKNNFLFRRKGNRLAEVDRSGYKRLYRCTDKKSHGTEAGIDYRKLIVKAVNEGGEQNWSRMEGGDVDGDRQWMLLEVCNSLRRVVRRTKEDRDQRIGCRW